MEQINNIKISQRIILKSRGLLYSRLADNSFPVIKRAKGPYLYDFDKNRYVDFYMSNGNLLMGHIIPQVTKIVKSWYNRGYTGGYPFVQSSQMLVNRIYKLFNISNFFLGNGFFIFFNSAEESYIALQEILRLIGCEEVINYDKTYSPKVKTDQKNCLLIDDVEKNSISQIIDSLKAEKQNGKIIVSDERCVTKFISIASEKNLAGLIDVRIFGDWLAGGMDFGAIFISENVEMTKIKALDFCEYANNFRFPPLYKIKAVVKFIDMFVNEGAFKTILYKQKIFFSFLTNDVFVFKDGFVYIDGYKIDNYKNFRKNMLLHHIYLPYSYKQPLFVSLAHNNELLKKIGKELNRLGSL